MLSGWNYQDMGGDWALISVTLFALTAPLAIQTCERYRRAAKRQSTRSEDSPGVEPRRAAKVAWVTTSAAFGFFFSIVLWEGVRNTLIPSSAAFLAAISSSVSGLAVVLLISAAVLSLDALKLDMSDWRQSWLFRGALYLQRTAMISVGTGVAFMTNHARNAIEPGQPLSHLLARIGLTVGPFCLARAIESTLRPAFCSDSSCRRGKLYGAVRTLYPAVAAIFIIYIAVVGGYAILIWGSAGYGVDLSHYFGPLTGELLLAGLGICFAVLELMPSPQTVPWPRRVHLRAPLYLVPAAVVPPPTRRRCRTSGQRA